MSKKYKDEELWVKSNEAAVSLLNEMFEMGAINSFEYEDQRETYLLYG